MSAETRARGAQLRTYRTLRGWTRDHLAFQAGVSPQAVYDLEIGRRGGLPDTWIALATALGVPPLALLAVPVSQPTEAAG